MGNVIIPGAPPRPDPQAEPAGGPGFLRLFHAVRGWSYHTFGPEWVRGPKGPLRHIEKEAREAIEAWDRIFARGGLLNPNIPDALKAAFVEQLADIQILLLDAVWRAGMHPYLHLLPMAELKMAKNVQRQWPPSTADEPTEHVRDEKTSKPPGDRDLDGNAEFGGVI